jgi:hypothetical protein
MHVEVVARLVQDPRTPRYLGKHVPIGRLGKPNASSASNAPGREGLHRAARLLSRTAPNQADRKERIHLAQTLLMSVHRVLFKLSKGTASVLEATAVAAGTVRPTGRRIIAFADIGAGTQTLPLS